MSDLPKVELTGFQADEVQGLLNDEGWVAGERRAWGRIGGGFGGHPLDLVVTDTDRAAEALGRRADHLASERAWAAARSLRLLADRIAQARA